MEKKNGTLLDVVIIGLEAVLGYKTIKIGCNFIKNAAEGIKKLVNSDEK